MKKNKITQINCHAEFSSASHEILKQVQDDRNNESGRSMVEMLGVLAIVGVLSVAGIAGYTTAMNAHRANEAINRVMKLAVLVSGQKLLGQTASLVGVDADNVTLEEDTANGKFTLKVSGLSDAVKNKIQGMDVATADLGTSGDDLTFTFYNDLKYSVTENEQQEIVMDQGLRNWLENPNLELEIYNSQYDPKNMSQDEANQMQGCIVNDPGYANPYTCCWFKIHNERNIFDCME